MHYSRAHWISKQGLFPLKEPELNSSALDQGLWDQGGRLNQKVMLNYAKRSNFPLLEAEVLVKDTLSTNSDNKNMPQHLKYS